MSDARTIAVVGAGLAGTKAGEALHTDGFDGEIVLFGAEAHRPYERPPLSKGYLQGRAARDTGYAHPPEPATSTPHRTRRVRWSNTQSMQDGPCRPRS